jgi:hypothetical protein
MLTYLSDGGEGGIRTPDTGVSPYNGLANRRLQPLGHLSGDFHQFSMARLVRRRRSVCLTVSCSSSEKLAAERRVASDLPTVRD